MKREILKKFNNSKLCLVCGMENELGLKARFYAMDHDEILAVCMPMEEHQSYPGRLHGGISAALLDETLGRAINLTEPDAFGVTIGLNLTYRLPVPLDREIHAVARITKNTPRIFEAEGEILLEDGRVAVEAKGRYVRMPAEKITDASPEEMGYHLYEGGDLKEFDL